MLKIIRNWELQDYLRSENGHRGYGIPVSWNYKPLKIYNAYYDTNIALDYFFAVQLNIDNSIKETFVLDTSLIIYSDGQYLIDETKLFGGNLECGRYYFEFNNGKETFYSQVFVVRDLQEISRCSGMGYCSSSALISAMNISIAELQPILRLEDSDYILIEK